MNQKFELKIILSVNIFINLIAHFKSIRWYKMQNMYTVLN